MSAYKYRAKYDKDGTKVYEEMDGEVLIDNTASYGQEAGYYIMPDIQPYQSMQTGEMIMGRAQHKSHLKQHRLIEIGNEPIKEQKRDTYDSSGLKEVIARQIYR